MFNLGGYAVLLEQKKIKIIEEFEEIDGEMIVYMTDGSSYHINQLTTIHKTAEIEGII